MNQQKGIAQTTLIFAVLGILIVLGVAWALLNNNQKGNDITANINDDQEMVSDQNMEADDQMMQDEMKGRQTNNNSEQKNPGVYKTYSQETVLAEQAAGNKVVLFFHAPWCPFCRAADSAFNSHLDEIPNGISLLKTDYDSNIDLRKKYGVTYQHTFVQIDNNGNLVSKWNGGDIDNLKKYIK